MGCPTTSSRRYLRHATARCGSAPATGWRSFREACGKRGSRSASRATAWLRRSGRTRPGTSWSGPIAISPSSTGSNWDAIGSTQIAHPTTSIVTDSGGILWAFSSVRADLWNGRSWHFVDGQGSGLAANATNSTFEDALLSRWFPSYGGLAEYQPDRVAPQTVFVNQPFGALGLAHRVVRVRRRVRRGGGRRVLVLVGRRAMVGVVIADHVQRLGHPRRHAHVPRALARLGEQRGSHARHASPSKWTRRRRRP